MFEKSKESDCKKQEIKLPTKTIISTVVLPGFKKEYLDDSDVLRIQELGYFRLMYISNDFINSFRLKIVKKILEFSS